MARGFGPTNVTRDESPFITGGGMFETPRYKGFFLALEGQDGAGKTTIRAELNKWFINQGVEPILTREPGGTPMAERIRELLLMETGGNTSYEPLTFMAETLLFMAARHQHLNMMVNPRLDDGRLVLTDRFVDSTFCYQGAGRGLSINKLIDMHEDINGPHAYPDLTIILDGEPEFFRDRMIAQRGNVGMTHFDRMGMDFHRNCRNLYLHLARAQPQRYLVVDAMQPVEQVFTQLIPALMQIDLHLRKRPSE